MLGLQLYPMSHNSKFARREVYIASDIGLFCSSLWAHYEWMRHSWLHFWKGKKKSYKVAMANASDLTETMQFGDDTHDVTEAVTNVCRNIFLKLYGDFSGNLVELRAHMFGRIKGDIRQLPQTVNAFRYHMLRAL